MGVTPEFREMKLPNHHYYFLEPAQIFAVSKILVSPKTQKFSSQLYRLYHFSLSSFTAHAYQLIVPIFRFVRDRIVFLSPISPVLSPSFLSFFPSLHTPLSIVRLFLCPLRSSSIDRPFSMPSPCVLLANASAFLLLCNSVDSSNHHVLSPSSLSPKTPHVYR